MHDAPVSSRGWRRSWPLGALVAALVLASTSVTFALVGVGVLALRVPQIEREHGALVQREAQAFARRQQAFLQTLEQRLSVLAEALPDSVRPQALLNLGVGEGTVLRALVLLDPRQRVQAAALAPGLRLPPDALDGRELAAQAVAPAASAASVSPPASAATGPVRWSERAPSPLDGSETVSAAITLRDGRLLLAELPLPVLLGVAAPAGVAARPARGAPEVWLVDRSGRVIAGGGGSTDSASAAPQRVPRWPLQPPRPTAGGGSEGEAAFEQVFDDGRFHVALARAPALDWTFMARIPARWEHPRIRAAVFLVGGAFVATLAIGLLLAPLFTQRLLHWLRALVAHAQALAAGSDSARRPHGPVSEFNALADSLDNTTRRLRERELELSVTFNAAPVAMAVSTLDAEPQVIDANDAWCRQFGRRREQVVGADTSGLRLWRDEDVRRRAYVQARQGPVDIEAWLLHADGSERLCRVSGRNARIGGRLYMVWANEDITEARRIDQQLRELNAELEQRVGQRTAALEQANAELQGTLDRLHSTRDELLRAERLASLGRLVAGVAHELSTPLGNSLMAVSTLHEDTQQFQAESAQGLRRATLDALLGSVEQATAIATRNLQRAAELLSGFKQVAADQTSAQRRAFVLAELVDEILLTLKPSFARSAHRVEAEVDADVQLDSYPGALGQVLTNLVSNALVHAFEDQRTDNATDHVPGRGGRIVVRGRALDEARVRIEVEDDGRGIVPALLPRIFDPFVTTRMGRGGTGLGLHIAHNAATQILGGTLDVRSTPGHGSVFVLTLPRSAPRSAALQPPESTLRIVP